jgi:hypothetical protein
MKREILAIALLLTIACSANLAKAENTESVSWLLRINECRECVERGAHLSDANRCLYSKSVLVTEPSKRLNTDREEDTIVLK